MKKQIIYLPAAIITGACLLFSSTVTDLPLKTSAVKNDCSAKNTCCKNTPAQAPVQPPHVTTFPGVIYIEM